VARRDLWRKADSEYVGGQLARRLRRSDEISDGTQLEPIAWRTHSVSAVALRALTRRYGERTALAEVTLSLETGQTLAVLGPNGAGKTTLLRLLATLLRPHDGELEVLGHRLPADGWLVRGRLGLLAHEPMLLPRAGRCARTCASKQAAWRRAGADRGAPRSRRARPSRQ